MYQTVQYDCAMSTDRRNELLDAALAYVAEHGLADFSLRQLAAAIGTSHRMLIHHFGSKAGLEEAVVQRLTEILTAPLSETERAAPELDARELLERTWKSITDPAAVPIMRLYLGFSSRATHGDPLAREVVDKIREHGVETALGARIGEDEAEVLLGASLTTTFLKGLLLDHLSGGSIVDAGATLERFIELLERSRTQDG